MGQMTSPNNGRTTTKRNAVLALASAGAAIAISGVRLEFPSFASAAETPSSPTKPWTSLAPSSLPSAAPVASASDLDRLNMAFTDLAARMSPTVVNIYTKTAMAPKQRRFRGMPRGDSPNGNDDFEFFFGNPFDRQPLPGGPRPAQALGSGFVISEEGYIVTNAHVVRSAGHNADEIMVKFNGETSEGKGHAAKIVGVDEITDVALLKLVEKKSDLKAIPLGNSDASKVGEWVFAIGNPYGHSNTLTQGIVSALGRNLEGARADFIQTSASINPGNSGGPLINLKGEVIGINTAIDPRAQGIGFAVPINSAKSVISDLMTKGRVARGWMGIGIQEINEEIAGYLKLDVAEGVLVKEVMPQAPAARAGLQSYDIIKSIDGTPIKSPRDLYRTIDKLSVGHTADVEILRDRSVRNLKVRVGERPTES